MRKQKPEHLKSAYTTVALPQSFLKFLTPVMGVSRNIQDLVAKEITGLTEEGVKQLYMAGDIRFKRSTFRAEHIRLARWMCEGQIFAFKVDEVSGDICLFVHWILSTSQNDLMLVRVKAGVKGFVHVCYDSVDAEHVILDMAELSMMRAVGLWGIPSDYNTFNWGLVAGKMPENKLEVIKRWMFASITTLCTERQAAGKTK